MKKLISPCQVSFLPGRHISENILIAQEVFHTFKKAKGKESPYFAWKIDLAKAQDKLRWSFIRDVLTDIGLTGTVLELIMDCVTNVDFKIIVNGELTDKFTPQRGIRQGLLEPYLFVMCIEKLSHVIHAAVNAGLWRPVQIAKGTRYIPFILC